MAVNTPIQGTAADIVKLAMLRVEQAIGRSRLDARMILQVHDELVLEVADGEAAAAEALLREAMEGAAALRVPLEVEVGKARSWAEAH
jgi:DNA polymerase-1